MISEEQDVLQSLYLGIIVYKNKIFKTEAPFTNSASMHSQHSIQGGVDRDN